MIESVRDKIQRIQNSILQDFFLGRMKEAFGDGWKNEIYQAALTKQYSNFSIYKEIVRKYNSAGINSISQKDFDITALCTLIRFDFASECALDSDTIRYIDKIRMDKNQLASHISNYDDTFNIYIMELSAVRNLRLFAEYIENSSWNNSIKEEISKKYLAADNSGEIIQLEAELLRSFQTDDDYETSIAIQNYLQDLVIAEEERGKQYVALSYNCECIGGEKTTLEALIDNIISKKQGIRISAKGGYGKSWSMVEMAGQLAKKYMAAEDKKNVIIPVLIEMGQLYNGCGTINEKIASMFFEGDKSKVNPWLKNNDVCIFVDAMDEAIAEIRTNVARELVDLNKNFKRVIIVGASRKSCIDLYPREIPLYGICEMNDEQIDEFFKKTVKEEYYNKAIADWISGDEKEFLKENRTPFYIKCYVELINEHGDNEFSSTNKLQEKFLEMIINREIAKPGFTENDKDTFYGYLRELCSLFKEKTKELASIDEHEEIVAWPENEVIIYIQNRIPVEEGYASIKTISRKLVEMRVLNKDRDTQMISFSHLNFRDYIVGKYLSKRHRWG